MPAAGKERPEETGAFSIAASSPDRKVDIYVIRPSRMEADTFYYLFRNHNTGRILKAPRFYIRSDDAICWSPDSDYVVFSGKTARYMAEMRLFRVHSDRCVEVPIDIYSAIPKQYRDMVIDASSVEDVSWHGARLPSLRFDAAFADRHLSNLRSENMPTEDYRTLELLLQITFSKSGPRIQTVSVHENPAM